MITVSHGESSPAVLKLWFTMRTQKFVMFHKGLTLVCILHQMKPLLMLPSHFFLRCMSLVSTHLHIGLLHGCFKYTFVTSSTDYSASVFSWGPSNQTLYHWIKFVVWSTWHKCSTVLTLRSFILVCYSNNKTDTSLSNTAIFKKSGKSASCFGLKLFNHKAVYRN